MSNYSRTTFFTVEVAGPSVPLASAADDNNRYALYERASTLKSGHRAGAWSQAALERLASRAGARLVTANSIARDSKGYIQASRREIV